MDIKHFLLLVASFSFLLLVQGRHRRALTDSEHYYGIYGKWYVIAEMNSRHIYVSKTCLRRTISRTANGESLKIRDNYRSYNQNMLHVYFITESSENPGVPAIDVTRFNDGKEIIFHDTSEKDSFVLLSRTPTVTSQTNEAFNVIAESLNLTIKTINNNGCI